MPRDRGWTEAAERRERASPEEGSACEGLPPPLRPMLEGVRPGSGDRVDAGGAPCSGSGCSRRFRASETIPTHCASDEGEGRARRERAGTGEPAEMDEGNVAAMEQSAGEKHAV